MVLPVNYLIIRALLQYDQFFGPTSYPTRSGRQLTPPGDRRGLIDRLVSVWLPGPDGRRPVHGGGDRLHTDPGWKETLCHEYFHGDNGAGLAACTKPGGQPWWPT